MALKANVVNELTIHKRLSRKVALMYYGIGDTKHAELVENCCNEAYLDDNDEFIRTWFCKDRWCPICAYRKARYMSAKCMELARRAYSQGYKLSHWTLTIPNVKARCLKFKIEQMNYAFNLLVGTKGKESYMKLIAGSMKCFEVTYNKDRDDFHLHIHALIVYSKEYDHLTNRLYYKDIITRWSDLMGYIKYDEFGNREYLQCKFKNIKSTQNIPVAVAEIVKYIFKPSSLSELQLRSAFVNFNLLVKAFKGMHQYDFLGILKKLNKEFTAEEEENFHFIQLEMEQVAIPCSRFTYHSNDGQYHKSDKIYFYNHEYGHYTVDDYRYYKYYDLPITDSVVPSRKFIVDKVNNLKFKSED